MGQWNTSEKTTEMLESSSKDFKAALSKYSDRQLQTLLNQKLEHEISADNRRYKEDT